MTDRNDRTDPTEDEKQLRLALRARKQTPPLGFDSRILHGAYARLRGRQRRRRLLVTANLALAMAACVVLVRSAVIHPAASEPTPPGMAATPLPAGPDIDGPTAVADILKYDDIDRDLAVHAHWEKVEEPLAPYAVLLSLH